jgi:hypothetical protein
MVMTFRFRSRHRGGAMREPRVDYGLRSDPSRLTTFFQPGENKYEAARKSAQCLS